MELALAAILGSIALGRRSLWLDETISVTFVGRDLGAVLHLMRTHDSNMSLYHLLLWAVVRIDASEVAVRSLSVLAFAATVPVLYLLVRRLADARAGLIAGLLLALNPPAVHFAQEARGYELCLLLVTASAYLFVRALEGRGWGAAIAYAVVAALAGYVHFSALFVPPALALSLLFYPRRSVPWRKAACSAGLLVVLLLPFAYLARSSQASSGVDWAAGNLPGRIATRIHERPPLVAALLLAGLACLVLGWWLLARALGPRLRSPESWKVAVLAAWLVFPVAAVCVLALVDKPIFVDRYFLVCVPPFVGLVALGLARIRRRALAAAALALVAGVSLLGTVRWYRSGQAQDWRGATGYVVAEAAPGDGILFYAPFMRVPFALYLERELPAGKEAPSPVFPAGPWFRDEMRFDGQTLVSKRLVREQALRFRRIWLVTERGQEWGAADPGHEAMLAGLEAAGLSESGSRSFAGIRVLRFVSPSAG
jgi:mannosyltransferase